MGVRRLNATLQHASVLQGTLTLPPDKAICQRAVLAAALARGRTELHPWPRADDCQWTLKLIEELGVAVARSPQSVSIDGRGRDGLQQPGHDVFCGESGTTLRLAAGLLAGQPWRTTLRAGPSLSLRPMGRIVVPLTRMGARVETAGSHEPRQDVYPPLTIYGARPLRSIHYEMPVASAQVKSCILLAGLFAEGRTVVAERLPTRDHTERILRRCGIRVEHRRTEVALEPGELTAPGRLDLPGDFSSAAFFIVAGACIPGSRVLVDGVGLNPSRTGLLEVLRRMGASVRSSMTGGEWEPRGQVTVEGGGLRGTTVSASEVPALIDELPILMVAAACAPDRSVFQGLGELRVKETDRIQSMAEGLRRMGVGVAMSAADTVEVLGGGLVGGAVESCGDHRTAMSLAVAGLVAEGTTVVRGAECVSKSFPEFFAQLRLLAGAEAVLSTGDEFSVDNSRGVC